MPENKSAEGALECFCRTRKSALLSASPPAARRRFAEGADASTGGGPQDASTATVGVQQQVHERTLTIAYYKEGSADGVQNGRTG